MKRDWISLLVIIGMALTMDMLGRYENPAPSSTYGFAAGVMLVAAYRIGRWSSHPEDRTQHQPPNPANERGSSH